MKETFRLFPKRNFFFHDFFFQIENKIAEYLFKATFIYRNFIAVYIDSLVMIGIERSETSNKRALEIQDKIFLKGKFFFTISPSNITF